MKFKQSILIAIIIAFTLIKGAYVLSEHAEAQVSGGGAAAEGGGSGSGDSETSAEGKEFIYPWTNFIPIPEIGIGLYDSWLFVDGKTVGGDAVRGGMCITLESECESEEKVDFTTKKMGIIRETLKIQIPAKIMLEGLDFSNEFQGQLKITKLCCNGPIYELVGSKEGEKGSGGSTGGGGATGSF
jgi:hypothetical protein